MPKELTGTFRKRSSHADSEKPVTAELTNVPRTASPDLLEQPEALADTGDLAVGEAGPSVSSRDYVESHGQQVAAGLAGIADQSRPNPSSDDDSLVDARQMLGDDFDSESLSSSGSGDLRPIPVPRHNLHRSSLVPSLNGSSRQSSEDGSGGSLGDSATLDGGMESADGGDSVVSDGGSVSSAALATASLVERMEFMRVRVKKSKDKEMCFDAARFIVDNVQFLPKPDQKQYCELAIRQLKKLSIAGLAEAQYLLANLYISGIPGFQDKHKPDYQKAFNLYASAARKDHPEALFHVGLCYEQGAGVPASNGRALHNYRKAAVR